VQQLDYSYNYAKVCKNSKWAVYDVNNAKTISDYKYDNIIDLRYSGLYKTYNNGKYGMFDVTKDVYSQPKGEIVPAQFNDIAHCGSNKIFKVSNGLKWAAYDVKKGSVVTDYAYDDIQPSLSGMVKVKQNGQWATIKY